MNILAVDPGTRFLGYAVIDIETERIMEYDMWDLRKIEQEMRFKEIQQRLIVVTTTWVIESMAVEQASRFNGNKVPELELAVATIERFARHRLPLTGNFPRSRTYHPSTWKSAIIGKPTADKIMVRDNIRMRYPGLPEEISDHITDAIGIGLYHLAMRKVDSNGKG